MSLPPVCDRKSNKNFFVCSSTTLQVNICSDLAECGSGNAGCVLENGQPVSPVGLEKTLEYSTDGLLKLTYKGPLDDPTGSPTNTALYLKTDVLRVPLH